MADSGTVGSGRRGGMIRARAHAKVNLCLEVLGRREDGYHEVATILQALALADEISAEPGDDLSLVCDVPSLEGPDNLALRAAESLRAEAGVRQGARLSLVKRIPVAAGLGGGSADAAAAMLALDRLWGTHLRPDDLLRLGAGLGMDVPFFLSGTGTALGEGRGDRIKPLGLPPRAWVLVLVPSIIPPERKTAALYGMLGPSHYSDGSRARAWAAGLRAEAPWATLLHDPSLGNTFDAVARQAYPGIERAWNVFREAAGTATVHLAGSGPALFALFPGGVEARTAREKLEAGGFQPFLTETATQSVDLVEG